MFCYTCKQKLQYSPPSISAYALGINSDIEQYPHLSPFTYTKLIKSLFAVYKFHGAFQFQHIIEDALVEYAKLDPFRLFAVINTRLEAVTGPVVLIPVPMTKRKEKQRGFSPAYELAVIFGRILAIKSKKQILLADSLVVKVKETQAQSKKKRRERLLSIHNSFEVSSIVFEELVQLSPAIIFIVDDIYTTGATVTELRESLVRAGIKVRLPNSALLSFSFARAERL
jgi:predicted amidophosphoribosyltransferase